jgi:glycosyltransferase involved in cell wall biosynthesis
MRILLCSDHYPPFIGGVQRQTRAMAQEFTARGHDVCVATVFQETLPAFEDGDGFPVHRLRQLRSTPLNRSEPQRRHQPPFPDPVTVIALRRLIRRFRPDVVHSSGWYTYSAAAALLGRSTPLLASAREYGFSCANASLLHYGAPCSGPAPRKCLTCSNDYFGQPRGVMATVGVYLSKPLLRRKVAAMHAVSHYVREIVDRDVFTQRERARVPQTVIGSFRVPEEGAADDAILAQLPTDPFILFVGAIRRVKGVQVLLDAYQQLAAPPPLVLLGTLEEDAPTAFPPNVHVLGGASYATVLAAWDRALLGVMPSLWPEPFGSVIHEAMSRGRAVIGTTPGGHEDMVDDGVSGLLVPPADIAALRDAMAKLIGDDELRQSMERCALERAELFTAERTIPRFLELYEQFAGGGERPVPALT